MTYGVYVSPGTQTEQIEESSWSSTAVYSHQAVVQTETDVFDQGTVLENRPVYLSSIAPVLEGTFQYAYDATDSGELSVDVEQTLILRAVGDEGQFEYWRDETVLGSERVTDLQPGERVTVPFSINITEARQRIEDIQAQLDGSAGETQILVESNMTITGQRNAVPVEESNTYQIRIEEQGNAYRVRNDDAVTDSGRQFRQETVRRSYGPLRSLIVPILFVLSVLGAVGLAVGQRQQGFELTDAEREWLSYRAEAEEFEEWLSSGTIPDEALARATVRVESLEDLVDIAIDSNRRVIRDHSQDICAVLLAEAVYIFELPDRPANNRAIRQSSNSRPPDETTEELVDSTDEDTSE